MQIRVVLYDGFSNKVTRTTEDIYITQWNNTEKYKLTETKSTKKIFENGSSILSLKLEVDDEAVYENKKYVFNLSIDVSLNSLSDTTITLKCNHIVYKIEDYPHVIILSLVLGAVSILFVIAIMILTILYREEKKSYDSVPPFSYFVMFGSLLLSILTVIIVVSPSNEYNMDCSTVLWLFHLSFLFILSPILGKMLRIHKNANININSNDNEIYSIKVLGNMFILIPCFILIIFLSIWTYIESSRAVGYTFYDGVLCECCDYSLAAVTISVAVLIQIVIYGLGLALSVRNIPDNHY